MYQTINFVLTLVLLNSLISLILIRFFNFKYARGYLYCGIFGHIPIKDVKPNELAFKILGIENESRGTDSCGYYYGGVINKGVDTNKTFSKYMEKHILQKGELYPNLIGHARSSSPGIKGGNTEFNSHPFEVGDLILTHNGVIYNIDSLAEKYEVDVTDINVDSHKLAKIIAEKGLDVLHNYIGHAALVFLFKSEPDVVYLYHGASKTYSAGKVEEERPLFVMETDEGVYYSSLESALLRIRKSEDEKPYILVHNTVIKIKEGVIQDDVYTVNREEMNVEQWKHRTYSNSAYGGYGQQGNFFPNGTARGSGQTTRSNNSSNFYSNVGTGLSKSDVKESIVLRETLPPRALRKTNIVFYWKGRHWIKKEKIEDIELADGCYNLDKKGGISNPTLSILTGVEKYYFVSGIMFKNETSYKQYLSDMERGVYIGAVKNMMDQANFAYWMARYSRWPITNLENEAVNSKDEQKNRWYIEDNFKRVTKVPISPKFSSRNYHFDEHSFLVKITSSDESDKDLLSILPAPVKATLYDANGKKIEEKNNEAEKTDIYTARINKIKSMFSIPFASKSIYTNNTEAFNCLKEVIEYVYKYCWQYDLASSDLDTYVNYVLETCVKDKTTIFDYFKDISSKEIVRVIRQYFEENEEELEISTEKKTKMSNTNNMDFDDESVHESAIEDISGIDEVDSFEYTTMVDKKISEIESVSKNLQSLGEVLFSLDFNENDDFLQELAQVVFRQRENLIFDVNTVLEKFKGKHSIKKLKD